MWQKIPTPTASNPKSHSFSIPSHPSLPLYLCLSRFIYICDYYLVASHSIRAPLYRIHVMMINHQSHRKHVETITNHLILTNVYCRRCVCQALKLHRVKSGVACDFLYNFFVMHEINRRCVPFRYYATAHSQLLHHSFRFVKCVRRILLSIFVICINTMTMTKSSY